MGLYVNSILVNSIHSNGTEIISVYHNGMKIWELNSEALSCFSNGYWVDSYGWDDSAGWKD